MAQASLKATVRGLLMGWVLVVVGGCTRSAPPVPPPAAFSVITYNVKNDRPVSEATLAAIARADADVVCLQEMSPAWWEFLGERLKGQYPHALFKECHNSAGGLAVFARRPIRDVAYLLASAGGWFPGWIVEADTPAGPVQILNVHLRPIISSNGSKVAGFFTTPQVRQLEMEAFAAHLKPQVATLVVGDFNEDDTGLAVRLLLGRGYADALAEFDATSPTCRHLLAGVTVTARLDHILHTPGLRCTAARVIREGDSDHDPVWARFERAAR